MTDFLNRERARIQRLEAKSENALDLVTRTIRKLEISNEQITEAKARIADYQAALTVQDQVLSHLEDRNTRIIENFSRLIEG